MRSAGVLVALLVLASCSGTMLSSVPCAMSVGPTVCSVTAGRWTSERAASLTKICCSIGPNPRPPYSLGQPTPSLPSEPIRLITAR